MTRKTTAPREGEWLWTTRAGAERDLVDELRLQGIAAQAIAEALVTSPQAPSGERLDLTFARQGFPVQATARGSVEAMARSLVSSVAPQIQGPEYLLHVWVPDTDAANPLGPLARGLAEGVERALSERLPAARRVRAHDAAAPSLIQVCLAREGETYAGVMRTARALSLAPGGRLRAHVPGDKPSRAARKLAEAFAWLGLGPEPGELCVDLGAAPGGWTWLLLERRARVIAVDPAKLRPDLLKRKGLRYVGRSAFEFEPDEPADWLFCDMAWRPVEVARMLARWGRKKDATLLVANFKLPMKKKAETVREIRGVLEGGGWRAVRTRQLYHDRDEITLTARVGA